MAGGQADTDDLQGNVAACVHAGWECHLCHRADGRDHGTGRLPPCLAERVVLQSEQDAPPKGGADPQGGERRLGTVSHGVYTQNGSGRSLGRHRPARAW